MGEILDKNVDLFDIVEDCDYLFRKDHQIRADLVVKLLEKVKQEDQKQRLLSVACSLGVIEEKIIKKLDIDVFGIDASKSALKEAEKRGLKTEYADVSQKWPFENSSFDFVFGGEILEHILDTKIFLKETNRVLKPGGYAIFTTPNLANINDRFRLFFGKTPRQTSPMHPYLYLHIRPFTFESMKDSLELCGFEDVVLRTDVIKIGIWGRQFQISSKILSRIFPTLGSTLIVRAKKK